MARWKLTLAYDGRPFAGWQSQPGGRSVQDVLEAAGGKVLKQEPGPRVHGSGRTDAGVHACGLVAHFDAPDSARLDAGMWRRALNVNLPAAVRVVAAETVPARWHARFDAAGKRYRYRIVPGEVLPPHEAGLAWLVPQPMDLEALAAACRVVEGRHDFAAFAANRGDPEANPKDTVRTIWSVRAGSEPALFSDLPVLWLDFHGEGFLYRMVRLLTGSILRVAQGREPLSWLERFLAEPAAGKTSFCAPADGLYLMQVDYPAAEQGGSDH